jgi:hypothetical protein
MTYTQAQIQSIISRMSPVQVRRMLRDVIDNMTERNSDEEIAKFVLQQLDGDALDVVSAYADFSVKGELRFPPTKLRRA